MAFDFPNSNIEKFYNGVAPIPIGQILTWEQLADVGFDIRRNRGLVYQSNKYLLKNHNKMLINVRDVGYKMAEASEQMHHAWRRKTFAGNQIKKALLENIHTDKTALNPDQRQSLTDRELFFQQQLKGLRKRNINSIEAGNRAISQMKKSVKIQEQIGQIIDELQKIRKS